MRNRLLAATLLILSVCPALATTLAHLSIDDIVRASDTIVEGRVESVRSFWQGQQILTEVTLSVAHGLKGAAGSKLSFIQMGGSVREPFPVNMTVPGAPVQSVGDEGFYFLQPRSPGQKMLVGLSLGLVLKRHDADGEFVQHEGKRLTAGEFADEVRRVIAGQARRPDPGGNR